jgi:hypothetical protein
MSFLTLVAIFVASAIIAILLAPKIEQDDSPGDFRPPEPREGEPINVIFGTVKVSPAVVWFGDVHARRVVKRESTLFGLISQDVPLGFDYYAGMQLVLCHGPIDRVLDIHIGEYHVAGLAPPRSEGVSTAVRTAVPRSNTNPNLPWDRPATGDPLAVYVNLPDLFGGPEDQGGIVGQLDIHWGSESQGQNPYLVLWMGPDLLSQYRGLAYVVLRRMNMGKSPNPYPWHFVCVRIPDVLGQSAFATIVDGDGNDTANPSECIYELLTNERWGVGMPPADIDIATFRAVAETLFDEGLGYNGQLPTRQTAFAAIRTILEHIDGLLYPDPLTGQIAIKLVRLDYLFNEVPVFDEQNATLEEFKQGSWGEVINETSVKYIDIFRRFIEGAAQAQNLASIQAMGEVITTQIDLLGFSTHELAQNAAARATHRSSVPVFRGRLSTNRFGFNLHQGSPFLINFPHHSISGAACRITSINYGSLTEGRMEIEFVEDPFTHLNPYGSPTPLIDNAFCGPLSLLLDGYNPADDPAAEYGQGEVHVFAAPYWHVGAVRRGWTVATRRSNEDVYWLPWRSVQGEEYEQVSLPKEFNAIGLLDADLPKTTIAMVASLTISSLGDVELVTSTDAGGRVAGDRLAILDNGFGQEIIAWETITDNGDGTYTLTNVMRGVLDTVPLDHPEGSRIIFYWSASGAPTAHDLSETDYADFTHFAIKATRVQVDGEEEIVELAAGDSVMLHDRAHAPYPPGKITLAGNEYDAWPASTTGDVTLGWTNRSRPDQTTIVAQNDATAYTLEGTITVEVLIEGLVVRTFAGLTGTSQVYTFAQRQADDANLTKLVQFRIIPIGASDERGTARVTPTFLMSA